MTTETIPQGGKRTGMIAVGAGFALMFLCGVAYSYGVAMPSIQADFGLNKTEASLPFSAILVAYTLGMVFGGMIQDRIGPRRACVGGAVLFGAGFGVAGLMPGLWALLVSYGLVCGFGIGVSYVAATATAVRWFPQRRGLAAGSVVLGFGLGALLLAPLKQTLIAEFGWRQAFVMLGVCFLLMGVGLALLVKAPAQAIEAGDATATSRKPSFRPAEMLRTRAFLQVWLAWSLAMCAALGWMGHLAAMARLEGLSEAAAAWALSVVALTNGISRPLVGALADRVGRLPTLVGACGLFLTVGVLMLLPMPGGWWFFALGALYGACFGTLLVNYSPLVAEFFGMRYLGSNLGLLFTSYGVGALTGPALFGALYDATGSYDAALQVSVVLVAVAAWLFWRVRG